MGATSEADGWSDRKASSFASITHPGFGTAVYQAVERRGRRGETEKGK